MADGTSRNPTGELRVGACQTPEILADPDAALTYRRDLPSAWLVSSPPPQSTKWSTTTKD
jgi:hypothetical protein